MRAFVLGLVLSLGLIPSLHAQSVVTRSALYDVQYRPAEARYLVGHYPHFDLIYQEGTAATAFQIAAELEAHRAATDSLVGRTGAPMRMPVVVNGFNDRSNGFVSPLPFRQEIEAATIKTDALTTYFPSWPAAVAPHELVHAAHADINAGVGLGGLVRLFGPDWSRVINLTAPRGLIEGVAVYRESQLYPRAGRLHVPVATMKYRAAMLSDEPWSLAQMMEAPSYTRPFDRHYVGGGQAFAYLQARDSSSATSFFHRTTRFHHRFPLLGFGAGLWYGTGTPPWRLDDQLRADLVAQARSRQDARRPFTSPTLIDGAVGLEYRRPHWIDDSTLVVHAEGYNVRPGFYAVDVRSGRRTLLRAQRITEDHVTTLSRDTSALYFARYVPELLVPEAFKAEAHRLDLDTGSVEPVTSGGRVHAPVESPAGRVWALRNDGAYTQWGIVQPDGTVRAITALSGVRIEQVMPSPDGRTVAVLLNDDGAQRLYRAARPDGGRPRLVPWLGLAGGAIYDMTWGPEGRYLVFAGDTGRSTHIFVLDAKQDRVWQLTNVAFGALEPTVSPDGTQLAFARYRHERFDLVRIPFQPERGEPLSEADLLRPGEQGWSAPSQRAKAPLRSRAPERITPYRPSRRLAPRLVYPTFDYDAEAGGAPLGLKVGVAAASADPLLQWAYRGEAFYRANRLWGRASVQSGKYLPRPRLTIYNEPTAIRRDRAIAERGLELSGSTPITFERNAALTQLRVQMGSALQQARLIDGTGRPRSDYTTQWVLRPAAVLGYRLAANVRDLVPSRGLILRSVAELDAWSSRTARRGWRASGRAYLPILARYNTGISLYGRLLIQNRPSVLSADAVLPRGYTGRGLPEGTFGALGADVVQPLWFVDDGWTTIPLYVKSFYAYGFGETLWGAPAQEPPLSAFGAGLGVRFRFFYVVDLDLRIGVAVRPADGDARVVHR